MLNGAQVTPRPSRAMSISSITGAEKLGTRRVAGAFPARKAVTMRPMAEPGW